MVGWVGAPGSPVDDAAGGEAGRDEGDRAADHVLDLFDEADRFAVELVVTVGVAVSRAMVVGEGEGDVGDAVELGGSP